MNAAAILYRISQDDPEVGYFAPEEDMRSDEQRDWQAIEDAFLAEAAEMEPQEMTAAQLHELIETNLWLAECYERQGEPGYAYEALQIAANEYGQFRRIMDCYAGPELGERIRRMTSETVCH